MGTDIHFFLVKKDGTYRKVEPVNGYRDYAWFDALQGNCNYGYEAYKYFPAKCGLPQCTPDALKIHEDDFGYYGDHYLTVGEFMTWYNKYSPDVTAGWVTKYDAWLYKKKNILPNKDNIQYHFYDDMIPEDWEFITMHNRNENSAEIWRWLLGPDCNDVNEDDYLVYFFDC